MKVRWMATILLGGALLAACATDGSQLDATAQPDSTVEPAVETLPATREADPPPAGAEAEFSTDFSRHTVPYSEILSGGPPKDGIPSIDAPVHISVEQAAGWLDPVEPVIRIEIGGEAHAYPLQIVTWHEIVNDRVGGVPVAVTFCPLCNTALAFERTQGERLLDFGTTGRLRYSNLIMYDRQTETWWQQATGEAIAGELTGTRLKAVPAAIIAWEDFRLAHPQGRVLSRDTGYDRPYGRNPYVGYDDVSRPPFLYAGPVTPAGLAPMARVLTIERGGEWVAYPYATLQELGAVNDDVGGEAIVVLWVPGTASALDTQQIASGRDVGSADAFQRNVAGQTLTFNRQGERLVDLETGSEWTILGRAVGGPLAGEQLVPVVAVNHFWFSWAAFSPETRIFMP